MEKMTFPFYFHDGEGSSSSGQSVVSELADGDNEMKPFGWSRRCLQFSTPTVLGAFSLEIGCEFAFSRCCFSEDISQRHRVEKGLM